MTLESAIRTLVSTVLGKMTTLIGLHNASPDAHSDIRTNVDSKANSNHVHGQIQNNGTIVMGVNDADFYLQRKKGSILGICKQTKERVAISLPIKAFLTEEELDELEYENYMDALGGDWQG